MTEPIPRNKINTAEQPAARDDAALEAEWLANNVPAQRLELRWRYESAAVQLYERRLRSLSAYGVGPALRSYLRTRLEWFCDNKLYAQPRGTVVVIVDAVSRKYFTSDTSWLWDICFDALNTANTEHIYLLGRYSNDLFVRFSYTGIPKDKISVMESIPEAVETIKAAGHKSLYTITCFSDKEKFLSLVDIL